MDPVNFQIDAIIQAHQEADPVAYDNQLAWHNLIQKEPFYHHMTLQEWDALTAHQQVVLYNYEQNRVGWFNMPAMTHWLTHTVRTLFEN